MKKNIVFSLYRVKFVKPWQSSLFFDVKGEENVFIRSLEDAVSNRFHYEKDKNFPFHVGNLKYFSESMGSFAFGRTTKGKVEKFDKVRAEFIDEEQDESPYTHCVFDVEIGIVAIARKSSLGRTTKEISRSLRKVLSASRFVVENNIKVEILSIPNPETFIDEIRSSYKVFSITAFFGLPNPFDADEFFQKPLTSLLARAHGESGKTTIKGDDLDIDVSTEIIRSSVSIGNSVSARVQKNPHERAKNISIEDNGLQRSFPADESLENVVLEMTREYLGVRYD